MEARDRQRLLHRARRQRQHRDRRQQLDWQENDIFVVPNFLWRRHANRGDKDAVLYAVSDMPLLEKIGQYRAQGRDAEGKVVQLVT